MPIIATRPGALEKLRGDLQRLRSKSVREELARRLAAAALKLVGDEFRQSEDPFGRPWKPVFRNRRRDRRARARRASQGLPAKADKPLIDTGRLKASAFAKGEGDAFRIGFAADYASYHQEGTRHIAQRQLLPKPGQKLPDKWVKAFGAETKQMIDQVLGKK